MGKLLGVEEVLRLTKIGPPRVSPRGEAAFNVARPDPENNREIRELWVLNPDGTARYYTGPGDSQPAWSPTGTLAFASRRNGSDGKQGKGQGVFIVGSGGEPRLVSWYKHGVWLLEWLDDNRILVGTYKPGEGYDRDGDYVMTRRLPVWENGRGVTAGLKRVIHVLDVYSGRSRLLAEEELDIQTFKSCGGTVYYVTPTDWRRPFASTVKSVEPGGKPRTVLEGYTVSSLACHKGEVYLLGHQGEIGISSHNKLYLLEDGSASCITCGVLDRNIWQVEPGGDGLYIVYADSGRGVLASITGRRLETVYSGEAVVYYAGYGGGRLYALISTPVKPGEIYLVENGRLEQLTRFNSWVEEYDLSRPVKLAVESMGDTVEGFVYLPPHRGEGEEKHPVLLMVHGGPKGMHGYGFNYEAQLFAAQGFIVVAPNPRGSDGYSESFADIRGGYGTIDYEQIMRFLDEVVRNYPADESRMAVTGISYGGYMTNVIITRTCRFRAAVSENGIADWIADYWASDIGYWFDPDQIGGTPLDNLEEYVSKSPAFHAHKVETPLLIIHSMEDYRCFVDQALAMHAALLSSGKESTLLLFTRGDHGHSVRAPPRHRSKRLRIKLSWIREKLGLEKEK